MATKNAFEAADKIAAFTLAVPALIGGIILTLALGSPDSAPYRDRGRMIPIAIGLLSLGLVGGGAYITWRVRKDRALKLDERAKAGALRLSAQQQTPLLIDISCVLAEAFVFMPGECSIPAQQSVLTAGQLSAAICSTIRKLESRGNMVIDPGGVDVAAQLVAMLTGGDPSQLHMTSDLNRTVPVFRRRKVWRTVRDQSEMPLPPLTAPKWAVSLAGVLALLITFGITIPLAQHLDQSHPIDTTDPGARTLAKFIVRGGFFLLLIGSAFVLGVLFHLLFPTFPRGFRTVGQLSAYLIPETRAAAPKVAWSKEQVWAVVQRIVAHSMGVNENQIQSSTPCQ